MHLHLVWSMFHDLINMFLICDKIDLNLMGNFVFKTKKSLIQNKKKSYLQHTCVFCDFFFQRVDNFVSDLTFHFESNLTPYLLSYLFLLHLLHWLMAFMQAKKKNPNSSSNQFMKPKILSNANISPKLWCIASELIGFQRLLSLRQVFRH